MGDRLQDLFRARSKGEATRNDVLVPLVAFLAQVIQQPPGFAPGMQQDSAECLMRILEHVDAGGMQLRVCGANAIASAENMIHCPAAAEAQVSRDAAPVSMAAVLQTSLTGDEAIQDAPAAIVIRVENMYMQGEDLFPSIAAQTGQYQIST